MISSLSRNRRITQTPDQPTMRPTSTPPIATHEKDPRASEILKVPVNVAATATRNNTSPLASLTRL